MGLSEVPDADPRRKGGLPRWMVLALSLVVLFVGMPLADFGLPWALSLLGTRYGWTDGGPGGWNLVGLVLMVVGFLGVLRFAVTGLRHLQFLPERVKLGLTPQVLMTTGPYTFSRNPRYLFAGTLWLGQAIFYGSVAVLIALVGGVFLVSYFVAREERTLERQFGEVYRRYRSRVPRWLGKVRR
jgi:protein-S-isoprenylcysteine O-methyltransferase Ste14